MPSKFLKHSCSLVSAALVLLATIGCGPHNPHSISITLDGQSVDSGYVFVTPDLAEGNDGQEVIFEINQGSAKNLESTVSKAGPVNARLAVIDNKINQQNSSDSGPPADPKTYFGSFELPESGEVTLDFKSSSASKDVIPK